ncbi:GntR family transcriptional regulator [Nonomuraea sp. GTA35]|uniref:GntR family transcriptional regulator n=1 Tax=Nonomuraea sp. GTA35 TaxID=1676746 RepID=UPI0035C08808
MIEFRFRENAPKWEQMADVLKARIADGTYPPDSRLPSQHELVQEFGVVPGTAQKVLTRLREQGFAYSVRGVGTFVASNPPQA